METEGGGWVMLTLAEIARWTPWSTGATCVLVQLAGTCHGDCDNDNDCDPGLLCFQRQGGQAVPGCSTETVRTPHH